MDKPWFIADDGGPMKGLTFTSRAEAEDYYFDVMGGPKGVGVKRIRTHRANDNQIGWSDHD
jgi:hypothetical protein